VFKRRYLIVKREENLSEQERPDLGRIFGHLPELKTLWKFSREVYKVWAGEQSLKAARWRWSRPKNNEAYREVAEMRINTGGSFRPDGQRRRRGGV